MSGARPWVDRRALERKRSALSSVGLVVQLPAEWRARQWWDREERTFRYSLPDFELASAADEELAALRMLGLGAGASEQDVRRAFRRLALLYHPDRGGTTSHFVALQQAYESLMNR
jgi:hypothetical protein